MIDSFYIKTIVKQLNIKFIAKIIKIKKVVFEIFVLNKVEKYKKMI